MGTITVMNVVAALGASVALAAGGMAAAGHAPHRHAPHRHAPHRHALRARIIHAELHRFVRGHDVSVRVDRGVIKSITSSSLVLHELDGNDVNVPLGDSTRYVRRRQPIARGDLHQGDVAVAVRREGEPARVVRSPRH